MTANMRAWIRANTLYIGKYINNNKTLEIPIALPTIVSMI